MAGYHQLNSQGINNMSIAEQLRKLVAYRDKLASDIATAAALSELDGAYMDVPESWRKELERVEVEIDERTNY